MAAVKTSRAKASISLAASLSTTVCGAREALLVMKDRPMPSARAPLAPSAACGILASPAKQTPSRSSRATS